jgi:polyhydroxyalkanoate synthesis regulator phasin
MASTNRVLPQPVGPLSRTGGSRRAEAFEDLDLVADRAVERPFQSFVDDTKDFVDDLLDRAKDLETDAKDAITDAVDDDEGDSSADVASLKANLVALQTKVEELTALQAKAAK